MKFFCAEAKSTLVELALTRQYPGEDLNVYMKRFYEKALNYCDSVAKDVLADSMIEDYRVYLESLSFSTFFTFMVSTMQTNKPVKKTLRPCLRKGK